MLQLLALPMASMCNADLQAALVDAYKH